MTTAAPTAADSSDSRAAPGASDSPRGWFPWLLTAAYAVTLGVGLINHEIWRDEAQAWLLARFADSPAGVICNIADEGHPGLWHLVLWAASRVVAEVWVMQGVHWVIAVAGAALIAFGSPFTKVQRVLLCFGYYSLFEYGMISRGYALGIALLYAAAVLMHRERRPHLLIGLLLALAANTSIYGCMLAGAVALGLAVDTLLRWIAARPTPRQVLGAVGGMMIWAVGAALCVWQVRRYIGGNGGGSEIDSGDNGGDNGVASLTAHLIVNPYALDSLLANFAEALLPLLNFFDHEFWGRNMLRLPGGAPPLLLTAVAVVWIVALVVGLSQRAAACVTFLAGLGVMLLFSLAVFRGWFTRHLGHYFILLVLTLWIAPALRPAAVPGLAWLAPKPGDVRWQRRASTLFTVLLAVHAAAGLLAWGNDLARPFSGAPQAAAAIERQLQAHPETQLLTVVDSATSPVAALLDRPLFNVHAGVEMTALDWSLYHASYERGNVPDLLAERGWLGPDAPPVVLLDRGVPPKVPGHAWVLLNPGSTLPILQNDEDYTVWLLRDAAASERRSGCNRWLCGYVGRGIGMNRGPDRVDEIAEGPGEQGTGGRPWASNCGRSGAVSWARPSMRCGPAASRWSRRR